MGTRGDGICDTPPDFIPPGEEVAEVKVGTRGRGILGGEVEEEEEGSRGSGIFSGAAPVVEKIESRSISEACPGLHKEIQSRIRTCSSKCRHSQIYVCSGAVS